MKHYLFVGQQLKITLNKKPSFKEISDYVVCHVTNIWKTAPIPSRKFNNNKKKEMQEALFDNMAIISDKIGVSDRIPTTISSVVLVE